MGHAGHETIVDRRDITVLFGRLGHSREPYGTVVATKDRADYTAAALKRRAEKPEMSMSRYRIRHMAEPNSPHNSQASALARSRRQSGSRPSVSAAVELEKRERQLSALYELWRATPYTDPGRLRQMLTERATAAMDAHACSLLLRDRGTDTLRLAASVGLPSDVSESVTLLVGERIAGRVAASRQPILVNKDPNQHPLLASTTPTLLDSRPEVESALCAPLLDSQGEAVGVLCLTRHVPAQPFTDADLRVFSLFAAQIGAVIAQQQTVDDLTRAAQEQAQLERAIARTAHLAQLGQFAAMVAHELRNPLSSIKGAAQFLLAENEDSTIRDFLSIVVEEVDGLGQLTTDLLEFARPTPPARHPDDLREIVAREIAFLREELARLGVTDIVEDFRVERAPIHADSAQLGRAVRNLLLNAAQSMAQVGNSRVDGRIEIALESNDREQLCLSIVDNGPGLPDSVRDRLFEPFFTTKAKGTGLGLAQVKRTIELHDGTVSADNCAGGGARFILCLPQAT
jgi:signal transduction histidine kinase